MHSLEEIRKALDQLDEQLVRLYERRIAITTEVAEYKIMAHKQVLDKAREEEKLQALTALCQNPDTRNDIMRLFEQILSLSRSRQYKLLQEKGIVFHEVFTILDSIKDKAGRVVYQGVAGAYSQQALLEYFGNQVNSYAIATWREAMEEIKNGRADYAVLPIENSSAGIVSENYDLLLDYDHYIVGEQTIHVNHCLLGVKGSTLPEVTDVFSHPQALMQCEPFLDQHQRWKRHRMENTALSAKKICEDGLKHQAAIASRITADIYGLDILQENINFSDVNSTRFIIVAKNKIALKNANRISICFELPHKSGTLYQMLTHFIYNNLNMNKIESRPMKDRRFEYRFFVDFEGNLNDSAVVNALHGLKEEAHNLRILGNY